MLVARWWHERMQGSWEAWCHSLADSALQRDRAKREEEARRLAEEKQALACKVDSFKAQLCTKSEEAEAARQLLQTSRMAWEQVAATRYCACCCVCVCVCMCVCVCVYLHAHEHTHSHTHTHRHTHTHPLLHESLY